MAPLIEAMATAAGVARWASGRAMVARWVTMAALIQDQKAGAVMAALTQRVAGGS